VFIFHYHHSIHHQTNPFSGGTAIIYIGSVGTMTCCWYNCETKLTRIENHITKK